MSRMSPPVELDTRRTTDAALMAPHLNAQNQAAAIVAVADEMRKLRQDMETRWHALETHMDAALGMMDGALTGLHQDTANLILRTQTVTRWLAARFPEFPVEAEQTLKELIATIEAEAAHAAEEETPPNAEPNEDHLSV